MTLDYFYGQAGELFSFYRIPKALFQEPRFQSLSTDAKTLYGIRQKMESCGILSIGSYLRKMALDGYCLNLDLPQLRRMAYLLQNCSNNLNQVAKRANESGQLYAADLEDLRSRLDELIAIGKQLLAKLTEL